VTTRTFRMVLDWLFCDEAAIGEANLNDRSAEQIRRSSVN